MPSVSSIYTQTFQFTTSATGQTPIQYFALNEGSPPSGSKFVIKYLSVASTTGFDCSSIPTYAPAVVCFTSDDGSGSNKHPFVSYNPGTPTSGLQVYTAIDESPNAAVLEASGQQIGSQLNSTQPYIGVSVNFPSGGGTFYVVITYILIPGGNPLEPNFGYEEGSGTIGLNSPINASNTNSRYVKSIIFLNQANTSTTYTIQMVALDQAGTSITGYIDQPFVIAPYEMACYFSPFFISANGTSLPGFVATSGSGLGNFNYYMSYCVGPA